MHPVLIPSLPRPRRLPPAVVPFAACVFLVAGLGANAFLAALSLSVLVGGCMLLWRPGEAPILLLAFAYQWLQASISVFHANWLDIDVALMSPFGGDQEHAIVLSLAGITAMAVGMRLGAGRYAPQSAFKARQTALSHPTERWFWLYAKAWCVAIAASAFAHLVPGLSQIALAVAGLKWAFYLMLTYATFVAPSATRRFFLFAFAVEFATGLGGFFSDFKTVFLFTIIALGMAGSRLSFKQLTGLAALGAGLVFLGVVWSAVKDDLRTYVSAGTGAQVVSVGYVDAVTKLAGLVAQLDAEDLGEGAQQLLKRITYVEFFGAALNHVPAVVPHEDGAILWDAVTRPFMPRLIFPEKTAIDDTARTLFYAGTAGGNVDDTSISLGHVAEAYIDFGMYGMMASLAAIGFFYGLLYRRLLKWSRASPLLGMALASSVLFPMMQLESSFTKSFGGVVVSALAAWLIVSYVVPLYCPWLRGHTG